MTALTVVAGSAAVSAITLLVYAIWIKECDAGGTCKPAEIPTWPAEMLRLTLVSSLAFVMGAQANGGT